MNGIEDDFKLLLLIVEIEYSNEIVQITKLKTTSSNQNRFSAATPSRRLEKRKLNLCLSIQ